MKKTIMFVDENGFEVNVTATVTFEKAYEAEPGNPSTYVPSMAEVELHSCEVIFAGAGVDILPMMNDKGKGKLATKFLDLYQEVLEEKMDKMYS